RLGLCQRQLVVVRVELDKQLTTPHELGLGGIDGDYDAADLGRQAHQVAVDVRIIGADVKAADEVFVDAEAGCGNEHHCEQQQRQATAPPSSPFRPGSWRRC